MPRKKKTIVALEPQQTGYAKSLKELEKENESIYNKKHVWMRRVFIQFLKERFPKRKLPPKLYPSFKTLLEFFLLKYFVNCHH